MEKSIIIGSLEDFIKFMSRVSDDEKSNSCSEEECEDLIESITSSDEVMEYLNKIHARKKELEKDEIKDSSEFLKEITENNINLEKASAVFSFLHDLKTISKDMGINYVSRNVIKELGSVNYNGRMHNINDGAAFPYKLIALAENLPMDEFFNNLSLVMKDPKNLVYGAVKFSEKVLVNN
jgi:Rad3-related DNA helicase